MLDNIILIDKIYYKISSIIFNEKKNIIESIVLCGEYEFNNIYNVIYYDGENIYSHVSHISSYYIETDMGILTEIYFTVIFHKNVNKSDLVDMILNNRIRIKKIKTILKKD